MKICPSGQCAFLFQHLPRHSNLTNKDINTINARITTPILRNSLVSSRGREDASEKEAGMDTFRKNSIFDGTKKD